MGIFTRAVGALFGINECDYRGGYEENSDCVDYSNGEEAARFLHYQEELDGEAETYTHTLRAGRLYPKREVTIEHTGVANFGDTDVYELASEYEAGNPDAFVDGFDNQLSYESKPGLLRSIFGFFEDHNL